MAAPIMGAVIDPEAEVRRLVDELRASGCSVDARTRLDEAWGEIELALTAGDRSAGGAALAYLEADPYYFRSGYARCRLAGRLSAVKLAEPQSTRARDVVLKVVDGELHCGQPGLGRLARSVADNELRRALRRRLHSPDRGVARRALRTIAYVRHPGFDRGDLETARLLVVLDAGGGRFLSRSVERLARWLWTPEWENELRDSTRHHGPHRAGAKKLFEVADQRRKRRPGP
jgi:hypothetical protein